MAAVATQKQGFFSELLWMVAIIHIQILTALIFMLEYIYIRLHGVRKLVEQAGKLMNLQSNLSFLSKLSPEMES